MPLYAGWWHLKETDVVVEKVSFFEHFGQLCQYMHKSYVNIYSIKP